MIFNTTVFVTNDVERFKEATDAFRVELEAAGATDIKVFQSVDGPQEGTCLLMEAQCGNQLYLQ